MQYVGENQIPLVLDWVATVAISFTSQYQLTSAALITHSLTYYRTWEHEEQQNPAT